MWGIILLKTLCKIIQIKNHFFKPKKFWAYIFVFYKKFIIFCVTIN